jgi:hypothetical protein
MQSLAFEDSNDYVMVEKYKNTCSATTNVCSVMRGLEKSEAPTICELRPSCLVEAVEQGCQIFLGNTYQNGKIYTN